jgi:hypothetical protein
VPFQCGTVAHLAHHFLKQADAEIDFELAAVDTADPFDPSWLLDTEKHCREADASVQSSVGPFGLIVLASDDMEEHTTVHFRVYKSQQKYMILMCSDLRRFTYIFHPFFSTKGSLQILNFLAVVKTSFPSLHQSNTRFPPCFSRSSLRPELYTPAYGGFFEFDLEKEKKISLRTLVS